MPFKKNKNFIYNLSIRDSIFIYFTVTALMAVLFIGISLYARLSSQLSSTLEDENIGMVNQVNTSMDTYIRNIIRLSDSLYYGIIKNSDLSDEFINSNISLLYDNNKSYVENIALLSKEGRLLEAVPAARLKDIYDIKSEEWFLNTLRKSENIHFSTPHLQYIFDSNKNHYKWVITVSRAVEITVGGNTEQAVLLIDLRYAEIENILNNVHIGNRGYIYMIDSKGEIIWHPDAGLIYSGRKKENNIVAASYSDGVYKERFDGRDRNIIIKSVGYTGWKIVAVTSNVGITLDSLKTKIFFVFIIIFILFIVALINSYISSRITEPIKELEKSVNEIEEGNLDTDVYIDGSYEIQHLGNSISSMADRIKSLMNDIVIEHEAKRRSEFDTLQSQINPHFLYNTLDIIVWMIENERPAQAVQVVTALARFFRISLSKGKNIITVYDEIEHVRNYLMIQHMRFKNKFMYEINVEEDIQELASLKLMLQPLVENAIYHGMEFMDGDGLIRIKAWREGESLFFSIEDNGLGMRKDMVDSILYNENRVPSKKGSGIGVRNVNERIKLYFGDEYGLSIDSEPDEGTRITLRLPAIAYSDIKEGKKNV